jgi:Lar family restriction alleviation protein
MNEKLKPCPFCGGTNVHIEDEKTEPFSYICCYDCLASFWQQEACDAEDNIDAWNRRAEGEEKNNGRQQK